MMIRLLAPILLFAAWPAIAEPPLNSGEIDCDRSAASDGCRLAWNMTATPRESYQLQSYSIRQRGWKNVGGPSREAYATRQAGAPGGTLYRVLACDDRPAGKHCVGSTVHWVLAKPKPKDIPESMPQQSGQAMTISKGADELTQLDQYNVYLLVQLLEQIDDLASMPAMTRPLVSSDSTVIDESLTDDDQIYGSIYHNYEAMRALAKEEI